MHVDACVQASQQADESRKLAEDTDGAESSWLLIDLFICVAGFVVAFAGKASC